MKEVPSTVTSPHFLPHDGLEPSTISKFMLNLHQSLTEEQSAVLKSNLSEDDLNRLRNNPFHIVDSEIAAIQAQWTKINISILKIDQIQMIFFRLFQYNPNQKVAC